MHADRSREVGRQVLWYRGQQPRLVLPTCGLDHHEISRADWWTHSPPATQGKPCSGELAEFGEQVSLKDPISRHAKADGSLDWTVDLARLIVATNTWRSRRMHAECSSTGRYDGFLSVNDGSLRP